MKVMIVDDHFVVRSGLVASLELEDDITFTTFKWEGRELNGVLAMIRMNLGDGSTGEWNSGQIVQGGQIVAWGGSVAQSDRASFNAEFELGCGRVCPPCPALRTFRWSPAGSLVPCR